MGSTLQTNLFDGTPVVRGPSEEQPRPTLRDYQEDCIEASIKAIGRGVKRQLISIATGGGKSVIAANLIEQIPSPFERCDKVLLLAHRDELISQLAEHTARNNPHLHIGIEQAALHAEHSCDVVVASVPTLGRNESSRLAKLNPKEFKAIVVDEAHHVVNQSYFNIIDYFGAREEGSHITVIGFTATPKRTDGVGLSAVFEEIVFHKGTVDLIEEKYLCRMKVRPIHTDTDLSDVGNSGGDFSVEQLSEAVNNDQRNQTIIKAYLDYAVPSGRKSTMIFAVNVKHAMDLCNDFIAYGINANVVTGGTDKEERRQIVEDFKKGRFPVMINVMVFTEGSDIPNIDCLMMTRPTKSPLLLQQMLGRGLRLSPNTGKEDCLVLDIVDTVRGKPVVTTPSLLGLDPNFDMAGGDAVEILHKMEEMVKEDMNVHRAKSLEHAEKIIASDDFDPFSMNEDPSIRQYSDNAWKRLGEAEHFGIEILDKGYIEISHDMLNYEVVLREENGTISHLGSTPRTDEAFRIADRWIGKELPVSTKAMLSLKADWNFLQPTINQIGLLQKFRIPIPTKPKLHPSDPTEYEINRREASNMISKAFARSKKRKAKAEAKKRGGGKIVSKIDNVKVGKL